MAVGQGSHACYQEACLGVHLAEGLYQRTIILNEFVLIIWPVLRVGIIDAKVYHHYVTSKGQSILVLLLFGVGTMSLVEQCGTRLAKVSYLVALAQHTLQLHRIGIHFTIGHTRAVGDTIAHTCHLNFLLLSVCTSTAQHNNHQINNSFHG